MILSPTSQNGHHHKVTNITMSPTSLSPKWKRPRLPVPKATDRNIRPFYLVFSPESSFIISLIREKVLSPFSPFEKAACICLLVKLVHQLEPGKLATYSLFNQLIQIKVIDCQNGLLFVSTARIPRCEDFKETRYEQNQENGYQQFFWLWNILIAAPSVLTFCQQTR